MDGSRPGVDSPWLAQIFLSQEPEIPWNKKTGPKTGRKAGFKGGAYEVSL